MHRFDSGLGPDGWTLLPPWAEDAPMTWYVDRDRAPVDLSTVRGPDGLATFDVFAIDRGPAGILMTTLWVREGGFLTAAGVAHAAATASDEPLPADDTPAPDPVRSGGGGGPLVVGVGPPAADDPEIARPGVVGYLDIVSGETYHVTTTDGEFEFILSGTTTSGTAEL